MIKDLLESRQSNGTYRRPAKGKGKGKGKGKANSHTSDLGPGLGTDRPQRSGEPRYAGRTEQEVAHVIANKGGWDGIRQFVKYRGKILTGVFKEGDLRCTRCGSATCRPWKEECWVCGATLPGGGMPKDSSKKKPPGRENKPKETDEDAHGPSDEYDSLVLPRAADMSSVKKRPPSSAATVLATVALKASPTYAEVVAGSPPPHAAPPPTSPPTADAPTTSAEDDAVNEKVMRELRAVMAKLPATAPEVRTLAEFLEKRAETDTRLKRQKAEAKSEAADFTGMTYECVLAHHETRLAAAKKRAAEHSAKREAEQESRRKDQERDRARLQKVVDTAIKELDEFNKLAAQSTAEWEASEKAKAADLQIQVERATEEVSRARAALQAAPAPNTKFGHNDATAAGKSSATGSDKGSEDVMGGKGAGAGNIGVSHPPTPKQVQPLITPPKLQPPTDPSALKRLSHARAVHQLWSIQVGDWPLTPEMLGLTTQEIAQLVGEAIWTRAPLMSERAQIPSDLASYISMALMGLEVSAAAQAAAESALGAARHATEAHRSTANPPSPPADQDECQARPNKHARKDTDAGSGDVTDMEM